MSAFTIGKPGGNRASCNAYSNASKQSYSNSSIPADFRERIAARANGYYSAHASKLNKPNGDGWASCRCLFHEDKNASASANLSTGGFRCHGCGVHGDLIAVHQRLTGLPFKGAVRSLLGLRP